MGVDNQPIPGGDQEPDADAASSTPTTIDINELFGEAFNLHGESGEDSGSALHRPASSLQAVVEATFGRIVPSADVSDAMAAAIADELSLLPALVKAELEERVGQDLFFESNALPPSDCAPLVTIDGRAIVYIGVLDYQAGEVNGVILPPAPERLSGSGSSSPGKEKLTASAGSDEERHIETLSTDPAAEGYPTAGLAFVAEENEAGLVSVRCVQVFTNAALQVLDGASFPLIDNFYEPQESTLAIKIRKMLEQRLRAKVTHLVDSLRQDQAEALDDDPQAAEARALKRRAPRELEHSQGEAELDIATKVRALVEAGYTDFEKAARATHKTVSGNHYLVIRAPRLPTSLQQVYSGERSELEDLTVEISLSHGTEGTLVVKPYLSKSL